MRSRVRAFLFAPSRRAHQADVVQLGRVVGKLSTATLVDAAYRRSGGRLTAFLFAQGIVVGAGMSINYFDDKLIHRQQ